MEFRILRGGSRAKKQDHSPGFQKTSTSSEVSSRLRRFPWDIECLLSGLERSPRELFYIQGSPPPSSRKFHLNKQEIKGSRKPEWMNNKLLTEFRYENKVYKRWNQGQVIQQEHRATVQSCRDRVRKAKAKVKLNL